MKIQPKCYRSCDYGKNNGKYRCSRKLWFVVYREHRIWAVTSRSTWHLTWNDVKLQTLYSYNRTFQIWKLWMSHFIDCFPMTPYYQRKYSGKVSREELWIVCAANWRLYLSYTGNWMWKYSNKNSFALILSFFLKNFQSLQTNTISSKSYKKKRINLFNHRSCNSLFNVI